MNQAQQKALIQSANMDLINIRSIELTYFSNFFSNFGTQTALMIGFITGSLSQVPGLDNPPNCWYGWIVLYWISSAITMGAAIHALVCCLFLQVFGQGLGLRGPLGSMVRAVEGMTIEQQDIVQTFLIAIFSFGFQCIGMYWIMMDWISATVSSIITMAGIIFWYRYSLRLYNRFSWSDMKVEWRGEDDDAGDESELDEERDNPLHRTQQHRARHQAQRKAARSGKSRLEEEHQTLEALSTENGQNETPGGYLTLRTSSVLGMDPWQRRYFVVRGKYVYYYKDKRAFQLEPIKPLNSRPIDLEGYTLIAGAREPPYAVSLIPADEDDNRKVWKFRCDTLSEFHTWIEIFSYALKMIDIQNGITNEESGELVDLAALAADRKDDAAAQS